MKTRMFLYIDLLGFSEMIKSGYPVGDLYAHIDALNVHRDNDFTCIVFSDTILVYGKEFWSENKMQAVMWLAEFAQDLFYRLIPLNKHFRAFITEGEFEHTKMNNIEAYYGQALVDCYEAEKQVNAMGVFLDSALVPYSNIFQTTPYNDRCSIVHVMQALGSLDLSSTIFGSMGDVTFPIRGELIDGWEFRISYEVRYIENIYKGSLNDGAGPKVRQKFANTLELIRTRHTLLVDTLIGNSFDLNALTTGIDWADWNGRVGTERGFFG
ncbi:MAG: hypothetical protein ABL912_04360 [Novosphingobium sp.]